MDFSKYYFIERSSGGSTGDGGASGADITQFAKDIVGGKAFDPGILRIDTPKYSKYNTRLTKGEQGKGKLEPKPKNSEEQGSGEETPKPKGKGDTRPKKMPVHKNFRSVGYITRNSHRIFDKLVSNIVDNKQNFGDNIIQIKTFNSKKFHGYEIYFKPQKTPGKEVKFPNYIRVMYLFKNNKGESANDWSSIGFRGTQSFKDAVELFFLGNIQNKDAMYKVLNQVKWDMQDPRNVNDPMVFASWSKQKIPEEDVAYTNTILQTAMDDKKKQMNDSFSIHYNCNQLLEAMYDFDFDEALMQLDENIIDDMLKNTFKGIGGGIKSLLKRPKIIKLSNHGKLREFFPQGMTYKVGEGPYGALNNLAAKSLEQWETAKKDYGVIARQFLKMKNVYVEKVFNIVLAEPKDEKTQEVYEEGINKMIKAFDIDTKKYDFDLMDIKSYQLTNGGRVSSLIIGIKKENNPEEQPQSGEQADQEADQNQEGPIDATIDEYEYVDNIFVIGFDKSGSELFTKAMGMNPKQFIQIHNSNGAFKKTSEKMDQTQEGLLKNALKTGKGAGAFNKFKKRNVDNEELNKILKAFKDSKKYAKGPIKSTSGNRNIFTFEIKDAKGGIGKVLFVNDGEGTPGRIIVTPKARKLFFDSKADPKFKDEQGSGYQDSTGKHETDN